MKNITSIVSIALALGLAQAARADLVTNGGFETGDFTGWNLSGNNGFISITSFAHSGDFAASFGAVGSDTFLTQGIATNPGDVYDLSFWLANDGGSPSDFSASFGGDTVVTLIDPPGFGYTEYSFTDLAPTLFSTTLQFAFRQDPAFFQIDDISVTDAGPAGNNVPDSGLSLALVAATFLGLCGLSASKFGRRQAQL